MRGKRPPHGKPKRLGWGFRLAAAWLVLVAFAALAADLLPIPHYDATLSGAARSGPSLDHPLGTDTLGRDLLSRTVHGARVSLGVGLGAVALGLLIGGPLGLIAGYRRGAVDRIIMTGNDVLLAFPALVFALAVVAFAGAGVRNVLIVLGLLGVPAWVRLIRGATLAVAQREFVTAARAVGARGGTVLRREIAPNVALPALSYAFVIMAVVVVAEGSRSILGLLPGDGVERSGRVHLAGLDLTAESPEGMRSVLGTRMGAVFQDPMTALDVTVQKQILTLLHRMRDAAEMAMILVSHDLAVVAEHADEVIVMYAGKVVEQGPAAELFAAPRMRYTEALLRAVPDLSAPGHTRLQVIEGRPPDLAAPPSGCRFHPRCPFAQDRCKTEEPPLTRDNGRAYACWNPAEPPPAQGDNTDSADSTDSAAGSVTRGG